MTPVLDLLSGHLRRRFPVMHAALRRGWWRLRSGGSPPERRTLEFAEYLAGHVTGRHDRLPDESRVVPLAAAGADRGAQWRYFCADGAQAAPGAMACVEAALQARPDCRLLYADHYTVDPANGGALAPCCKPAFDPVRLAEEDYIGPFFVIHRTLLSRLGADAQRDPRALPLAAAAVMMPHQVVHLPAFLHAVAAPTGTAAAALGSERAAPEVAACSVSVIVPTRDGLPHLRACVEGVLAELRHIGADGELLIVDNGSECPETLAFLRELPAAASGTVRVLRDDRPFNYSALNNQAARIARGEMLLLLNDDVAPQRPGWLGHMVACLQRPQVGAVGAHLHYPDGRLQHAGVALGLGGVAGHPGAGLQPDDPRLRRIGAHVTRSVSAVTGACLLTWKHLYWDVDGLNERDLPVAFNDVDYCLKLGARGWRVLCTPHAVLTHLESVSRGAEDSLARQRRFAGEVRFMRQQWADRLADDPYYSPHLTRHATDLAFRWPSEVPMTGRSG